MKNENIRILLVDDEEDILEIIQYNLTQEGYQVYTAKNGIEAIAKAKKKDPHLIILDVMMPEMDGIEACEILRTTPGLENTIITFLTARGEDYSQLAGFDAGADDYIQKPIRPKVLVSKIKALLRRRKADTIENEPVRSIGELEINREEYKVINKGEELILPRKEFELLFYLASRKGRVLDRQKLLNKVWGDNIYVVDRTVDVHVRKIREKLGDHYIETVKGVGYRFKE